MSEVFNVIIFNRNWIYKLKVKFSNVFKVKIEFRNWKWSVQMFSKLKLCLQNEVKSFKIFKVKIQLQIESEVFESFHSWISNALKVKIEFRNWKWSVRMFSKLKLSLQTKVKCSIVVKVKI